jgi:N-acetylglucosaminyldiphosphoundecaprenol N-acetyl-beta-D-mannosaminyltransferase
MACEHPDFARALASADWLVPDGVGVTLGARVLGVTLAGRITGNDIFETLSRRLNEITSARVFFLGSTEDTLAMVRSRYEREYPRLRVVGTFSPPYRRTFLKEDLDVMAGEINRAKADVLWVGLGAPKQELVLEGLRDRLTVKFAAAIGAVFDFYTGRVRRSHPIFQQIGLEWLPRLAQEPRRLWRRTVVSAPIFLWHVAKARVRAKTGTMT